MSKKAKRKAGVDGREFTRVSVSFHPTQLERAEKRAEQLGFTHSFSAYIQTLVDRDTLPERLWKENFRLLEAKFDYEALPHRLKQ